MSQVQLFPMSPLQSWAFLVLVMVLVGCAIWCLREIDRSLIARVDQATRHHAEQTTEPLPSQRQRIEPEPYDHEKHGL